MLLLSLRVSCPFPPRRHEKQTDILSKIISLSCREKASWCRKDQICCCFANCKGNVKTVFHVDCRLSRTTCWTRRSRTDQSWSRLSLLSICTDGKRNHFWRHRGEIKLHLSFPKMKVGSLQIYCSYLLSEDLRIGQETIF